MLKNTAYRTHITAALTILAMLLLSGCFIKIDTTLNFETTEKGSRRIVISYSPYGREPALILDTSNKIDAAIKKRKPAEINYEGYKINGDDVLLTFSITFATRAEYTAKVAALLKASGESLVPQIDVAATTTGLVTGAQVNENFTSEQLLGWLPPALVAENVVSASDATSFSGYDGDANVNIGGATYESYKTPLRIEKVKDNGFGAVGLVIKVSEQGTFETDVQLEFKRTPDLVTSQQIDAFLKTIVPATAKVGDLTTRVDPNAYYESVPGKNISFASKDLAELNTQLAKIMGSPDTKIAVKREISSVNPTDFEYSLGANVVCVSLCSPDAALPEVTVEVPDKWAFSATENTNNGAGSNVDELGRLHKKGTSLLFSYRIPFQLTDVNAVTTMAGDRALTQTIAYTLDAAAGPEVVAGYRKLLQPATGVGTFNESKSGNTIRFVATFTGDTAAALEQKLDKYAPGAKVLMVETGGNALWPEYSVGLTLPIFKQLQSGLAGKFTMDVVVPKFNSVAEGQSKMVRAEDGQSAKTVVSVVLNTDAPEAPSVVVKASGPSDTNLITMVVIAAVILALIAVALIFRRQIAAGVRAVGSGVGSGARKVAAAQSQPQAQAHAQPQPQPQPQPQAQAHAQAQAQTQQFAPAPVHDAPPPPPATTYNPPPPSEPRLQ